MYRGYVQKCFDNGGHYRRQRDGFRPERGVGDCGADPGIYKACEDITGEKLDAVAKQVGAEELVVTGDLADAIGSVDAAQIVNQLKEILDQAATMSDDEVRQEIRNIGKQYGQGADGQPSGAASFAGALHAGAGRR